MNTTNYTSQIIDLSFLASNYEKSNADFLADLHDETLCNSKLRDNAGIENLVFGNGNVNADVFFIYDSPSEKDEHSRLAMSGEVGDFFFSLLSRIGISRNDVYIAPIMKYRVKNGDSDINRTEMSPIPSKINGYYSGHIHVISAQISYKF